MKFYSATAHCTAHFWVTSYLSARIQEWSTFRISNSWLVNMATHQTNDNYFSCFTSNLSRQSMCDDRYASPLLFAKRPCGIISRVAVHYSSDF